MLDHLLWFVLILDGLLKNAWFQMAPATSSGLGVRVPKRSVQWVLPKDRPQEPYYRFWQAKKWVILVQECPEVRVETKPVLIPSHMLLVAYAGQRKGVESNPTPPGSSDGALLLPARWEIYWTHHGEVAEEQNRYVLPAVLPLPDPKFYKDVRQSWDNVQQILNLQWLGTDIKTPTSPITPGHPPGAYI